MSNKQEALWCPICDVPSDECEMPDSEECEDDRIGGYAIMHKSIGHSGHWITLAERARDEALSNLDASESDVITVHMGTGERDPDWTEWWCPDCGDDVKRQGDMLVCRCTKAKESGAIPHHWENVLD